MRAQTGWAVDGEGEHFLLNDARLSVGNIAMIAVERTAKVVVVEMEFDAESTK